MQMPNDPKPSAPENLADKIEDTGKDLQVYTMPTRPPKNLTRPSQPVPTIRWYPGFGHR